MLRRRGEISLTIELDAGLGGHPKPAIGGHLNHWVRNSGRKERGGAHIDAWAEADGTY